MQTSLWKMTALMGVVGIGVLVVLQAQRGLSSAGKPEFTPPVADAGELDLNGDRRADEVERVPPKPSEPLRFAAEPAEFEVVPSAFPEPNPPRTLPTNASADVPTPVEMAALPAETPMAFRRELPSTDETPIPLERAAEPLGKASVSGQPISAKPAEIRVALNDPAPFGAGGSSTDTFGASDENPFFDSPEPPRKSTPTLPNPEPDPNGGAFDEPVFPTSISEPKPSAATGTTPEFDPYEPETETTNDSGPALPTPAGPFDLAAPTAPTPVDTAANEPVLPELSPAPNALGSGDVSLPTAEATPTPVDMRTPAGVTGPEEDPLTAFGLVPEADEPQPEPVAEPTLPAAKPSNDSPVAKTPVESSPFDVAVKPPQPVAEPKPEAEPEVDPLDNLNFNAGPALGNAPTDAPPQTDPTPVPIPAAPVPMEAALDLQPEPETKSAAVEPAPTMNSDEPRAPGSIVTRPEELTGNGVITDPSLSEHERPQLKIEKVAPPRAVLNEPMVYKIVVRNAGQRAAHQVVVEDQIPKGTRLTGTIPRAELSGTTLRWKLGKLEANDEKVISVRVIPLSEGKIGSVAKVNFVAEVAARTVITSPKIALTLDGPSEAAAGSELTYTFKLTNTGQTDAEGVYLRNLLPSMLSHPGGNDLEYEVGNMAAGETKQVSLTVTALEPGNALNKAIVTASGGVKVEASRQTSIVGTRLSITRTGPKRRFIGRAAVYENTVQNDSTSMVQNVRVVETVPAGMRFVSANGGGQYDAQSNTVTWIVPQMAPQAQQKLTVQFLPTAAGAKKSTVVASEGVGSDAMVESETEIEGYTALRLDVAELRDPVDVGEEIALRFITKNRGTEPATNVRVSFTLSPQLQLVSADGPSDAVQDGDTVSFTALPSVAGEVKFDVVLKAVQPGSARIEFALQSDQMSEPLRRDEALRILPPE